MPKHSRIRPAYDSDSSGSEANYQPRNLPNSSRSSKTPQEDDDLASVPFGTLRDAQSKLQNERTSRDSDSDSEGFFEESDSDSGPEASKTSTHKKRSKHAPAEASSKKPVSRIRDIQGLPSRKSQTLHTDIRFDAAYGKADLTQTRKNYAFLDEYRKQEISNMEQILKDKKSRLGEDEKEEIRLKLQSLKSRMDTLKNRDLEDQLLKEYKKKQYQNVKEGKSSQPYFLKRGDKRKILQKAKYDSMKPKQREKAMERKRKRRLGKEFRQLEFRPRNE
ncbi:RRP36 [Candida theae]|uniref:rRNA biogenesis protein RRP36 n=1 Tax=Candida theae TaxID=1198502 RepID=A0AAD5FZ01_9ASCO|nr:RRP36 [Candida theae]KAI5958882.1 RRP36 [Candida theae]